jgi:hypothetical protein
LEKPRIIGVVGRKQSGKDTIFSLIQEAVPCKRIAFGDALRDEVGRVLRGEEPIPEDAPEILRSRLEQEIQNGPAAQPDDLFKQPYRDSIRRILQTWGTEYRRVQNPDYWLIAFLESVRAEPATLWVVTDVRFVNESECIKHEGGILWRVTRPASDANPDRHSSERFVDLIRPSVVLENRWGIAELRCNVLAALRMTGVLA